MNSATKNIFEKLSIGKWTVQFTDTSGLDNPTNIIGINNHNKILTIVLEDSDIFLDDELLKNGTQELLQISDNYIEIMYRLTNTDVDIPEKLIFRKN